MESPRKHKYSGVPFRQEAEPEDGNDLLVKCGFLNKKLVKRRRTEVSESIVQVQQQIEVFDMENKVPDGLPAEDSTGKDPIDVLTNCPVQNSGQANGCSNESAISRLLKLCRTIGWEEPSYGLIVWEEPSYDFEEQGPPHMRMFKCKVTVHLDGLVSTIVECFSNPKPMKEAAQESAAQGALWYLQCFGYVK